MFSHPHRNWGPESRWCPCDTSVATIARKPTPNCALHVAVTFNVDYDKLRHYFYTNQTCDETVDTQANTEANKLAGWI